MKINLKRAISAVIAASIGTTAAIMAQTPSSSAGTTSVGSLEEIVVTARRVEERLQDVPISITVFNQEQLSNRNVVNAADLANYTPSLSANTNFGPENTSFAIRGFVQDAGTPPSVGVYFADVVAPRGPTQGTQAGDGAGPGYFFDLQNVQVLKGPQGTLFGRNTTGGAVLFVPQKPTSDFEGYVEASYGNYGMKRVEAALNAPFNDAIRFRLAVDRQERDGYLRNISGIGPSAYNNIDYTAVRASLIVELTSNLENYMIASYLKSDTNGGVLKMIACNSTGSDATGFTDPRFGLGLRNFIGVFSCAQLAAEARRGAGFYDVEAAVPDPISLVEQRQVINTTTWTASDALAVKNIASYAEYKDTQRSPLFGTNWQVSTLPGPYPFIFGGAGIPAVFTGIFPIPGGASADQSTYTEEIQLTGSVANRRFTYQTGVYLEWSDPLALIGNQSAQLIPCTNLAALQCTDSLGITFTGLARAQNPAAPPSSVGVVNYTAGKTTYRDQGLYAQSSFNITDRFKVTGGLRYTSDKQTNEATRITYNFPVTPPFTASATSRCTDPSTAPTCSQSLEQESSKPTWLIDFDYKPTQDALLYAKYARGYRAGGVFTNAPIDHRTFEPEKVDSYEAGAKTTFNETLHGLFDIAIFYNDFSNQQLQAGFNPRVDPITGLPAPVSPTTAIVNAGKSRIYGAEIDASISPVTGLTFDVSYTYLNATIQEIASFTTTDPNYTSGGLAFPTGSQLVLSPKNKYSITGNYVLPLPKSIGRISFGATFTHTDEQVANYAYLSATTVAQFGQDYGHLGARNLLNLNLSWNSLAGLPLDVSAFASNVTQKEYYQFIPGLAGAGAEFGAVGEPRMYGMRLRYRFGK